MPVFKSAKELLAYWKKPAYRRIISAILFRNAKLAKKPDVSELEFINIAGNHGQLAEKLQKLGQPHAAEGVRLNARYVGLRWLDLGRSHLQDAGSALSANSARSTFSRSYYAVYNASKAVRYIVVGVVSLKGDDHHKASDLPNDFPHVDKWAEMIPRLYEHRLFSDYDNWSFTQSQHTLSPQEAFDLAKDFLEDCASYLHAKFGL